MAVNLDTNGEDSSTSYKVSEGDVILSLECDQVSVELKADQVGVMYTKDE